MSSCAFLWLSHTMRILALHGFTGCGDDFTEFSPLCHSVDTWHCPNLPGHGPEPSLNCTPEATLRFVEAERSTSNAQHSTPNILLGYSMGARAALQHACKYPDAWDALILISPNPGIEDNVTRAERRSVDEKLAQRIERKGVDDFIKFWQSTPMIRSQKNIRPDWCDAMQANRQQHTATGLATSLRQFGQGHCPNLWPELDKLAMPTLLVTGSEDLKYTRIAERMFARLPYSVIEVIDGIGHMPHLEGPETCADAINDFLNDLSLSTIGKSN